MDIILKKITMDDWQDYKTIRLEGLRNESTAFASSYEEEKEFSEEIMKERSKSAILAYSDSKPIGLLVYLINSRMKTRHVANIYSVYVNKNYRGLGVGKKLIKKALALIKQDKKVIKVNLGVNPEQISALKLYESFGFKIVGLYQKEVLIGNKFYDTAFMELFF